MQTHIDCICEVSLNQIPCEQDVIIRSISNISIDIYNIRKTEADIQGPK